MTSLNKKQGQKLRLIVEYLFKTHNGRLLGVAIIAGLFYLPTWLSVLCKITFVDGKSTILLNTGLLYLSLKKLWKERFKLTQTAPFWDDKFIGHSLILVGTASLPFSTDSSSLQAFIIILILSGVLINFFEFNAFLKYPLSFGMLFASLYPDWAFLSTYIFQFLTGPNFLENIMAKLGSKVLGLLGQQAIASGQIISLPSGSVLVGSGCSGFDMAFSVAGCSILLGLFMKQKWQNIFLAVFAGVCLALLLNIPRIVLLTFAAVYWGEDSFDFWHGAWGGQIFSTVMFTIYYYIVMNIYRKKGHRRQTS